MFLSILKGSQKPLIRKRTFGKLLSIFVSEIISRSTLLARSFARNSSLFLIQLMLRCAKISLLRYWLFTSSTSSRSFTWFIYHWPHDCSDRVGEKVASYRGMAAFQQQYIDAVSGPIFVKLANDFNMSCLSPTFVKKIFFPLEHITGKGPSIKPANY